MCKFIFSLIILSSFAHASTNYDCGSLKLSIGTGKIKILGLVENSTKSVSGIQTRYSPSAKNAGSTRFDISSICQSSGDVYAILDKSLTLGKPDGELTIQSTCDADAGAPSFERYTCRTK